MFQEFESDEFVTRIKQSFELCPEAARAVVSEKVKLRFRSPILVKVFLANYAQMGLNLIRYFDTAVKVSQEFCRAIELSLAFIRVATTDPQDEETRREVLAQCLLNPSMDALMPLEELQNSLKSSK